MSLYEPFYSNGGSDQAIEYIDTLVDPEAAFENNSINKFRLYEYLYILNQMAIRMRHIEKVIYLNRMRGMTQAAVSELAGISQVQVSRLHSRIIHMAVEERSKFKKTPVDPMVVNKFASDLLGREDDDDLCDKYQYDLGAIKICREILMIANMYQESI